MNKKLQKGTISSIIVLIGLLVIIGGLIYYFIQSNNDKSRDAITEDAMTEKDGGIMEKDFDLVIAKANNINLKDVSDSGISGTAWLAVYNNKTYHRVIAKNVPALSGTDFYEGWLVKNAEAGDFFSTGKMEYNPDTKEATLNFVVDGDKSDYRFVVITSEPDDGNPKPDKHIIEEHFPEETDLQVVIEGMM